METTLKQTHKGEGLQITVDAEHGGIRTVGCFTFILGTIISFIILQAIFVDGGLLVGFASVFIGLGLTYFSDTMLKRYWPSTRTIQIKDDAILVTNNNKIELHIDPAQTVNTILWHFEAPKHPRVPKGWYVIASALEQEGTYIASYCIASPDDFFKLPLSKQSTKFERRNKKDKKDTSSSVRDLRAAGQQRRIEEAEFHRGEFGAEMKLPDYQAYIDSLIERFPEWMPQDA